MWRSKVIVIPRSRFYIAIALIFLTVLSAGSLRFGAAEVGCQVLSYAVAQKVVVIDPGHGGIDPGATGPNNTLEKDINLEIARRLAQYLSQAGAVVILTRETDNDLADEGFQGSLLERKRQDLARMLEKAQTNRADLFISIHCNADVSPRWAGAQVFYCDNSEEGKKIAQSIQSELKSILGNTKREAKQATYFITDKSQMPSVIVEVGFLSNPREEALLADESYQARVAYAIFSGIVKYNVEEAK